MFRTTCPAALAAAVLSMSLLPADCLAQTATPAPPTVWNWMGIPKNPFAGIRNKAGNFPGLEKKVPLKAIADPANLESPNAVIKKAAEIKAEEDLAPQKIKAIKYLAEIGCGGCYEGVGEALAAALDDCTEEVRYEAVKAVITASACADDRSLKRNVRQAKPCKESACDCFVCCMKRTCATMGMLCGKPGPDGVTLKSKLHSATCRTGGQCQSCRCACGDGNCCTSEILNKLSTMAFERDDRGCWKEPSPRVRSMARLALQACGPNIRPMTPADMPIPEEVPLPETFDVERVEEPDTDVFDVERVEEPDTDVFDVERVEEPNVEVLQVEPREAAQGENLESDVPDAPVNDDGQEQEPAAERAPSPNEESASGDAGPSPVSDSVGAAEIASPAEAVGVDNRTDMVAEAQPPAPDVSEPHDADWAASPGDKAVGGPVLLWRLNAVFENGTINGDLPIAPEPTVDVPLRKQTHREFNRPRGTMQASKVFPFRK